MKVKKHVLYLPGLGDQKDSGQMSALRLWKIFGLEAQYHKIGWADGEVFGPKQESILKEIDKLTKEFGAISLVGVSAGASAALSAYIKRKDAVDKIVLICGKINNPQTIGQHTFDQNPAFKDSLDLLPKTLKKLTIQDRKKIMSIHPLWDGTVPVADTIIQGAKEKTIPTVGHVFSIAYAITVGSFGISQFIKAK